MWFYTGAAWEQLSAAEGISKANASYYKALIELDPAIVKAFADVNDLTTRFARVIRKTMAQDGAVAKAILNKAKEIRDANMEALSRGQDVMPADEVARALKQAGRAKKDSRRHQPPEIFKGARKGVEIKKSTTNKGAVKLELKGLSEESILRILEACKEELGR